MNSKKDTKDKNLINSDGHFLCKSTDLSREIFDALKIGLVREEESDRTFVEKRLQIFSQVVEQSPVTVVITDLAGRIEYVNPKFTQTTGYTRIEALGQNPRILKTGTTKQEEYKQMWRTLVAGVEWRGEFYNRRKDGSCYWESALIAPIINTDGKKTHYLAIKEDITQRKTAEEALRMNEARLAGIVTLLENDDISIKEFLDDAMIVGIDLTESQIGYIYLYNEVDEQFALNSWSKNVMTECSIANPPTCYALASSGVWGETVRQRKPVILNDFSASHPLKKGYPPGHAILQNFATIPIFSGNSVVAVIGVANKQTEYVNTDVLQLTLLMDSVWKVVERKRAQEALLESNRQLTEATQLSHELTDTLENFDQLTGLANRSKLHERLSGLLNTEKLSILLLINVDRFKTINNARGFEMGDILLKGFAKRLLGLKSPANFVGRLGADEFVILYDCCSLSECNEMSEAKRASELATAIREEISQLFMMGEEEVLLTVSVGAAVISCRNAANAQEALRRADTALRRAKAAGGNQSVVFDTALDKEVRERYAIEMDLRRGIAGGELRLYLQPQVDSAGTVEGVEALVRWQHPERGLMFPDAFIPIAEESPLIIELGQWVLTESCRIIRRLELAGRPISVSVNVSPSEFHLPDFVDKVKQILIANRAKPSQLVLEVTEGLMIRDIESVIAKMDDLAAIGVRFSIDDFGTGYSSLSYLKRLPIVELKIDRTFVQNAPNDPSDAVIVDTILSIAKHMKLRVVAEGVETEAHAIFLRARGEMINQGYLYGRPEDAEKWLGRYLER